MDGADAPAARGLGFDRITVPTSQHDHGHTHTPSAVEFATPSSQARQAVSASADTPDLNWIAPPKGRISSGASSPQSSRAFNRTPIPRHHRNRGVSSVTQPSMSTTSEFSGGRRVGPATSTPVPFGASNVFFPSGEIRDKENIDDHAVLNNGISVAATIRELQARAESAYSDELSRSLSEAANLVRIQAEQEQNIEMIAREGNELRVRVALLERDLKLANQRAHKAETELVEVKEKAKTLDSKLQASEAAKVQAIADEVATRKAADESKAALHAAAESARSAAQAAAETTSIESERARHALEEFNAARQKISLLELQVSELKQVQNDENLQRESDTGVISRLTEAAASDHKTIATLREDVERLTDKIHTSVAELGERERHWRGIEEELQVKLHQREESEALLRSMLQKSELALDETSAKLKASLERSCSAERTAEYLKLALDSEHAHSQSTSKASHDSTVQQLRNEVSTLQADKKELEATLTSERQNAVQLKLHLDKLRVSFAQALQQSQTMATNERTLATLKQTIGALQHDIQRLCESDHGKRDEGNSATSLHEFTPDTAEVDIQPKVPNKSLDENLSSLKQPSNSSVGDSLSSVALAEIEKQARSAFATSTKMVSMLERIAEDPPHDKPSRQYSPQDSEEIIDLRNAVSALLKHQKQLKQLLAKSTSDLVYSSDCIDILKNALSRSSNTHLQPPDAWMPMISELNDGREPSSAAASISPVSDISSVPLSVLLEKSRAAVAQTIALTEEERHAAGSLRNALHQLVSVQSQSASSEVSSLESQVELLNSMLDDAAKSRDRAESSAKENAEMVNDLRREISHRDARINKMEVELEATVAGTDAVRSARAALEARCNTAVSELVKVKAEKDVVQSELAAMIESVSEAGHAVEDTKAQLVNAEARVLEQSQLLQDYEEQHLKSKNEFETYKLTLQDVTTELEKLQHQCASQEERLSHANEAVANADAREAAIRIKLCRSSNDLDRRETELEKLKQELATTNAINQSQLGKIETLESKLSEAENSITESLRHANMTVTNEKRRVALLLSVLDGAIQIAERTQEDLVSIRDRTCQLTSRASIVSSSCQCMAQSLSDTQQCLTRNQDAYRTAIHEVHDLRTFAVSAYASSTVSRALANGLSTALASNINDLESKLESKNAHLLSMTESLCRMEKEADQARQQVIEKSRTHEKYIAEVSEEVDAMQNMIEQERMHSSELETSLKIFKDQNECLTVALKEAAAVDTAQNDMIAELEKNSDELKAKLQNVKNANSTLESELKSWQAKAQELGIRATSFEESASELQKVAQIEKDSLEARVSSAQDEIKSLRECNEGQTRQLEDLKTELSKANGLAVQRSGEASVANAFVSDLATKLKQSEAALVEQDVNLEKCERSKKEQGEKIAALSSKIAESYALLKERNLRQTELESEVDVLNEDVIALKLEKYRGAAITTEITTKMKILQVTSKVSENRLLEQLEPLRKEIQSLNEDLNTVTEAKSLVDDMLAKEQSNYEEVLHRNQSIEVTLQSALQDINQKEISLNTEITRLETQVNELQGHLDTANAAVRAENEARECVLKELKAEKDAHAETNHSRVELEDKVSGLSDDLVALQAELQTLKKQFAQHDNSSQVVVQDLESAVKFHEQALEKERIAKDSAERAVLRLEIEIVNLNSALEAASNAQNAAEENASAVTTKLQALNEELFAAEEMRKQALQRNVDIEEESVSLRTKVTKLEDEKHYLDAELDRAMRLKTDSESKCTQLQRELDLQGDKLRTAESEMRAKLQLMSERHVEDLGVAAESASQKVAKALANANSTEVLLESARQELQSKTEHLDQVLTELANEKALANASADQLQYDIGVKLESLQEQHQSELDALSHKHAKTEAALASALMRVAEFERHNEELLQKRTNLEGEDVPKFSPNEREAPDLILHRRDDDNPVPDNNVVEELQDQLRHSRNMEAALATQVDQLRMQCARLTDELNGKKPEGLELELLRQELNRLNQHAETLTGHLRDAEQQRDAYLREAQTERNNSAELRAAVRRERDLEASLRKASTNLSGSASSKMLPDTSQTVDNTVFNQEDLKSVRSEKTAAGKSEVSSRRTTKSKSSARRRDFVAKMEAKEKESQALLDTLHASLVSARKVDSSGILEASMMLDTAANLDSQDRASSPAPAKSMVFPGKTTSSTPAQVHGSSTAVTPATSMPFLQVTPIPKYSSPLTRLNPHPILKNKPSRF